MKINFLYYKNHLKPEGFQTIINHRASINKGLSLKLKQAFPNTIPTIKPLVENQKEIHPI